MSPDPLSPSYEDISTVISILPVPINDKKPGLVPGQFSIPAVKDPETEFAHLVVTRCKYPVYIDENRPALIVPEPSDRVAAAICRDYKISMAGYKPGIAEPGLFWVVGKNLNTPEVADLLKLARKFQREWLKFQVSEADDVWEKYHMRKMLSGLDRIACNLLGLQRDWNIDSETTPQESGFINCPFCFGQVHPEASICMHCRNVINEKKAATLKKPDAEAAFK